MLLISTMISDYQEIDPSPDATIQRKWLEERERTNPTVAFAKYCNETPWAPECKEYEV